MARRKRHTDHGGGGGGGHGGGASSRWLVSYSDFITLLFVVFVVLYSFANINLIKFGALANSFRESLGPKGPDVAPFGSNAIPGQAMPVAKPDRQDTAPPDWPDHLLTRDADALQESNLNKTPPPADAKPAAKPEEVAKDTNPTPPRVEPPNPLKTMEQAFKNAPGASNGTLTATLESRGLVLQIVGSVLFEPGKYTLRPEAATMLDGVAGILKGAVAPVMVEGSADDHPVSAPGVLSPMSLAAMRGIAVVDYLKARPGMGGLAFAQIAYSDNTGDGPQRTVTIIIQTPNQ
ncbi:MAG: flagellar motor protein MotB [Mycobacterium leprae]